MKKAKLDILESIPGIELELPGAPTTPTDETEVPVESGNKWAFNKLLLMGMPILLLVLIIGGIVTYFLMKNISSLDQKPAIVKNESVLVQQAAVQKLHEKTGAKENTGAPGASVPEPLKIVYVRNFMIDLKDANGNNRVLMCDVAFDIAPQQKQDQLENNTNVRNLIYKAAQSRSAVALRSVEERKKLKKELASALGKMLGEGSVKNVYFINYFIM